MDLVSTKNKGIYYNWGAWESLCRFVERNGISTVEFSGSNDGSRIKAKTCKLVADVIERRASEYNKLFGSNIAGGDGPTPAAKHAKLWRGSGGFRQW